MENKSQSLAMLDTVATFAANDVNLLATKWGYHWPDNTDESRLAFLCALWEDKGNRALVDIAAIHPDRQLILAAKKKKKKIKMSSADGSDSVIPSAKITSNGFNSRERLLIMAVIIFAFAAIIHFAPSK